MADRPSSSESSDPVSDPSARSTPPGLGEQFGRTRSALLGLISAHLKLARAELSEIASDIKRAAALGGIALLLLFLAGMLVMIGGGLFLGEALFHSIGWGVLLGGELLIGAAVLLVLAIVDLGWGRAVSAFLIAVGVGLAVTGVFAVDWASVSRNNSGLPGAVVLAVLTGAVVFGLLGAALAASFGRGAATAGLVMGGGDGGGAEGGAEGGGEAEGEVRAPALTIEGGGDFPDEPGRTAGPTHADRLLPETNMTARKVNARRRIDSQSI